MEARRKSLNRDAKHAAFWGTAECARLGRAFNVFVDDDTAFQQEDVVLMELMIDWCQPFNKAQHSMGVLSVRCSSLHDIDKCKDMNTQVSTHCLCSA
jgi:hypothetical protein